jgi:hypothetical protein
MATDYTTECGSLPLSFIQMLASTIVGYHDLAGALHYRINGLESADGCTELSDFHACNTSHIDPERQLVENTFALDDCSRLAWKVFSNSDNDWEDYSECGEVPQSLIQLLARCIVEYSNTNRINAVIDTGACTSATALLDCVVNNIESERLLVSNVFAVDDCDRLLIKFFANSSTMTDYHTECNDMPQSFYQLLARCIVEVSGHYYINTASVTGYCDDLHDFWTCAINHIDPERALVENVFATDSCGNLALKIFNNSGDSREQ